MSNKKIIKEMFNEKFNSNKIRKQILFKYERKEKMNVKRIVKYVAVPIVLVLAIFVGSIFLRENDNLEKNNKGSVKVYAYTMFDGNEVKKKELKDNVKLGLASYSRLMSSVPGYPIMFEIEDLDYLKIEISNGKILNWDKESGKVEELGNNYQLSKSGTLYFNVSDNTNIKVCGMRKDNKAFEKNIVISKDDYNFYAIIK